MCRLLCNSAHDGDVFWGQVPGIMAPAVRQFGTSAVRVQVQCVTEHLMSPNECAAASMHQGAVTDSSCMDCQLTMEQDTGISQGASLQDVQGMPEDPAPQANVGSNSNSNNPVA